ncbi:MAG: hypothetical protein KDB73_18310 [Planctomycetes bacterium]|nr:hypothetical protein [Planctomycetota bacterium]
MPRRRLPKRPHPKAIAAAAHHQDDAGPDRVVCLLCGEEYRAIRASHLVAKHGFEWHRAVEKYKARFGLRVAASEEVCEAGRQSLIGYWKARGQHWTKARLRRELRARVRDGLSVAASAVGYPLTNAAHRLHGGWSNALVAAGLDPNLDCLKRTWTGDGVSEEIRRLAAEGDAVTASRMAEEWPGLYKAALDHFGSWADAVTAAGLDPERHRYQRRIWTLEACEAHVRDLARAGKPLTTKDVPVALYRTVMEEYDGGWMALLASVGAKPAGATPRRDWTAKAVLAAIRRRKRDGRGLGASAVMADGGGLYQQGWKFFGSWTEALRAAGVDPDRARQRVRWTRAGVVEALRERSRGGLPLDANAVSRDACGLYKAARRHLGASWPDVLAAAGVGKHTARAGRKK